MNTSESIQKMVNLWTKYVSQDHHKSRDYYFYIDVTYRPEETTHSEENQVSPIFTARHNGYVGDYHTGPERSNFSDAESDLQEILFQCFLTAIRWAEMVLEQGKSQWHVTDIEQAQWVLDNMQECFHE